MSDAAVVEGEQGGAGGAVAGNGAAAVEERNTRLGGGEGGEGGEQPPNPLDNWRELAAGGDEAALKQFARMGDLAALGKSYREMHKKLSAGQTFAPPPENALPEEIVAYRKRMGIPEAPDGYKLAFPEEMKPTEGDTAALAGFQKFMHDRHVPPTYAKAALEYYTEIARQGREAQTAAIQELTLQGIAEMRGEWKGLEFDRNRTIGYEFLEKYLGEKAPALAAVRLADGRVLGQLPDFNRLIVAAGRAVADEDTLIAGDINGGGRSVDTEYNDLLKKGFGGRSQAEHERMLELQTARLKRNPSLAA